MKKCVIDSNVSALLVYLKNNEILNEIRKIGILTEALLKIIINTDDKITLGEYKVKELVKNIKLGQQLEFKLLENIEIIKQSRDIANHHDVHRIENMDIDSLLTDTKKSLEIIKEYVFIVYFIQNGYLINNNIIRLFSLLPPSFRKNILEAYKLYYLDKYSSVVFF